MAVGAVKIEFSWSRSMALSWTRCGEENHSSSQEIPAAFNTPFFSRITIEKLIQTLGCVIQSAVAHILRSV